MAKLAVEDLLWADGSAFWYGLDEVSKSAQSETADGYKEGQTHKQSYTSIANRELLKVYDGIKYLFNLHKKFVDGFADGAVHEQRLYHDKDY